MNMLGPTTEPLYSLHRPMTRRDWIATGISLGILVGCGLLLYRFPHSRVIWWICVGVLACMLLLRLTLMLSLVRLRLQANRKRPVDAK